MLGTLNPRERRLVIGALPVVALAAFYNFVWMPIGSARAEATADIERYRGIIATAAVLPAPEADRPRTAGPVGPLAARLTQSAEAAGLSLRRLEPEGTRLRIALEDTRFDRLLIWVSQVERTEAARVIAAEITRRPEPGTVSASLTLEDTR